MTRESIQNPDNPEEHDLQWQRTHLLLSEIYAEILERTEQLPTIKEVAKLSGFSERHVQRHIKIIKKKPFEDRLEDLQLLTRTIILAQGSLATTRLPGCTQAARFFMEIVEGMGSENKNDSNALGKLSGEELDKQIEEMNKVLDGKIVKFPSKSLVLPKPATGEDQKSV